MGDILTIIVIVLLVLFVVWIIKPSCGKDNYKLFDWSQHFRCDGQCSNTGIKYDPCMAKCLLDWDMIKSTNS